ncbi:MAG: transcriptional regulator [Candidatus Kariarchaeaceae archaeon]
MKYLLILMLLLTFQSIVVVKAGTSWEDDFEKSTLDNWNLFSYNSSDIWDGVYSKSDSPFNISNGALTSPDLQGFTEAAKAYRSSSNAYGSWSFDWTVSDDGRSFDAAEFILNDYSQNFNWTGLSKNELNLTGYSLVLVSYDETSAESTSPGLDLVKLSNSGSNLLTRSLDSYNFDSPLEGTHHIDIERDVDGEFKIYFNSELVIQVVDNSITTSEKFGLVSWIGASSFDNIIVSGVTTASPSFPLLTLFLIVSIVGLGYFILKYTQINSDKGRYISNKHLVGQISEIIDNRPYLFYLVFGQALSDSKRFEVELKNKFPIDIFNYKFLMQPVRLAITKLLYENSELSSIEIKEILQITWGSYSTHTKALKKKEYILVREEFVDGSVKQILNLSPKGIDQYNSLTDLLQQFLRNADEEDIYLKKESDTFQWLTNRSLYPENNA